MITDESNIGAPLCNSPEVGGATYCSLVGMVNAMAILILALQCRYVKDFPLTAEEMVNGWNIDGTAPAVDIKWNISLFAYFGLELEWITPWLSIVIFGVEVLAAFLISLFLPKLTTSLPATLF